MKRRRPLFRELLDLPAFREPTPPDLTDEQIEAKLAGIPEPEGTTGKCPACGTEKVRVLTDLDNYASEWDCPSCQPLECVDYPVGIWVRTAGGASRKDFH